MMSKKPSQKKAQSQKTASKKSEKNQKTEVNITVPFEPQKTQELLIYVILVIISAVLSIYYINYANTQNGYNSFPLDDPWIHLTFAKNLAEYGSFSYFKNEMATAGSTSPVYTILLAAGFFITKNEMILSYVLGIAFLICSVIAFYKLSSVEFGKENYFALACTGIFILDKWMNFIADSGMETTMYIFFLIAGFYFYKKRKAIPFAILFALTFWTRPDAVAFYGAIIIDYIIVSYFAKTDKSLQLFSKNDLMKIAGIAGGILVLYFIMNLILSGSLLPNTYNAKLDAPMMRTRDYFLKEDVWGYFTTGAYGIIMIGFLFSSLKYVYDLIKRKYNQNSGYILFCFCLVFIYWLKLPYTHRFGRYLMPLIPFLILVSMRGFRDISQIIGSSFNSRSFANGFFIIIVAVTLVMSAMNYNENKQLYAEECKYIYDRHVKAAFWIKDNTTQNNIIAAHDVGAIGFYSERKIVDVAGLISPEVISKLKESNYNQIMSEYMKQNNVSYLVFLQEWYTITNQNPLYTTLDTLPPEVMEIYKFIPETTLILSNDSRNMNMYATNLIQQKAYQQAINVLQRSLAGTPNSSYTYYLIALAYGMGGDAKSAEVNLVKAIQLFPEYKQALLQLGNIYLRQGKYGQARESLTKAINVDPNYTDALNLLKSIPDTVNSNTQLDTLK
jgi:arabinofuranosyltransferase